MSQPAYLRYPGDYARKTKHLSMTEHGAYGLLMDHYYSTGKPIPKNSEKVKRISGAKTKTEICAVNFVLAEFFIETEEGFIHKRVQEELLRSSLIRQKRSYAAQQRWNKAKLSTDAHAMHMHSTCNASGYAKGYAKPMQNIAEIEKDTLFLKTSINSTKEKIKKENIPLKKIPDALPEWIPADLWADYLETRRKKKIPNTQRAMTLLVNKLAKFRQSGHDPKTMLENAIEAGWSSFYEPKGHLNAKPDTAITRSNGYPYQPIGDEEKTLTRALNDAEENRRLQDEVTHSLKKMGMQKRDDESQEAYNLRLQTFCRQGIKKLGTRRKPLKNPVETQK